MPNATSYRSLSDKDLLSKLAEVSRHSAKAALVLTALTDDNWYDAVTELRRRCACESEAVYAEESAVHSNGRVRCPHTIEIDSLRWKSFWFHQGLRIGEVGPLVGLVGNWASTIACKEKVSALTLERIACELNLSADDVVWAVASDRHRERIACVR